MYVETLFKSNQGGVRISSIEKKKNSTKKQTWQKKQDRDEWDSLEAEDKT